MSADLDSNNPEEPVSGLCWVLGVGLVELAGIGFMVWSWPLGISMILLGGLIAAIPWALGRAAERQKRRADEKDSAGAD
jgi:F0F1-type ATP synthase assembly protein I